MALKRDLGIKGKEASAFPDQGRGENILPPSSPPAHSRARIRNAAKCGRGGWSTALGPLAQKVPAPRAPGAEVSLVGTPPSPRFLRSPRIAPEPGPRGLVVHKREVGSISSLLDT